jgi:MerR family copper efflux transcriptional regulator
MAKIGAVAKATGVTVEAIRYYERLGLLPEASRTPSGYREFPPGVERRVRFIQRAQALGFSLDEIRQLLELRASDAVPTAEVKERVDAKLRAVEAKIAELDHLRKALESLGDSCCAGGSECPILDALDGLGTNAAATLEQVSAGTQGAPPRRSARRHRT